MSAGKGCEATCLTLCTGIRHQALEKKPNVLFVWQWHVPSFPSQEPTSGNLKSHFKEEMHFDAAGLIYGRFRQKYLTWNINIWWGERGNWKMLACISRYLFVIGNFITICIMDCDCQTQLRKSKYILISMGADGNCKLIFTFKKMTNLIAKLD